MAIDFTKPPVQIVLDLINENNGGVGLTSAQVTFGLPTVATGGSPARNTELTLTAVPGSGYSDSVTIMYDRVNIADIAGGASKVFTIGDAATIADLIPEINARYGFYFTADDFVDGPLPTFAGTPNEQHSFSVVATADSLIARGTLVLTVESDDIPLHSVITTTTMNGLTFTPLVA